MRAEFDQSLSGVNLVSFLWLHKLIQWHEESLLKCPLVGFKNGVHVRPLLQKFHNRLLAGVGLRQDGRGRLLDDLSTCHFRRGRCVISILDFAA